MNLSDSSRVSVLIPTYNRAQFLGESVRSVLGQTVPPLEVLIIDDGSTDDTAKVARGFGDTIRYIHKENGGKSTAINLGLQNIQGEFVWVMDDDDVALPDALERHLAALAANPGAGFSYSGYILGSTRPDGTLAPGEERPLPQFDEQDFLLRLMERNFIRGSPAMLVRSACFREVGNYDTALIRSQDYEMTLRLAERFPASRVAGYTYYYRAHAGERGSASTRFDGRDLHQRWREFNRIIFRGLRQRLPLERYLPGQKTTFADKQDGRRALLQRMTIMACNGLIQEMLADLRAALSMAQDSPLTDEEKEIVRRAMEYPVASDPLFSPAFLRQARRACQGPLGKQVAREMTRVLYWRLGACADRRDMPGIVRFSRALLALSGITGLASTASARLQTGDSIRGTPAG
jgi:glycosyltransferase involved in cell wall biosynthesis